MYPNSRNFVKIGHSSQKNTKKVVIKLGKLRENCAETAKLLKHIA